MHASTRLAVAALAAIIGTSVALGVTDAPPPAAQEQTVTLTGCLRNGSGPAVFILRGATSDAPGSPRDYLLVDAGEGVDLAAHVNRRVAVSGRVWGAGEGPSPPEGANTAERALRRQTAASVREVASECLD